MTSLIRIAPVLLLVACSSTPGPGRPEGAKRVHFAHLSTAPADVESLSRLRGVLQSSNPGCALRYEPELTELGPTSIPSILLIQNAIGARATVTSEGVQASESELSVGDLIVLRPTERLSVDGSLSALIFQTPQPLPANLPSFVRPDHDPLITDKPGGCAEEEDAYRRILLTWLPEKGAYVYHGLNVHRVRIRDSFTHYHPIDGGFDELYLVQGTEPGARLIYSERVDRIERNADMTPEEAVLLMMERELQIGDLVYMPRGTAHRGFGGLLVQVIALPGFVPGAEIGIDHRLRELNRRLDLRRDELLPYNAMAATEAVTK